MRLDNNKNTVYPPLRFRLALRTGQFSCYSATATSTLVATAFILNQRNALSYLLKLCSDSKYWSNSVEKFCSDLTDISGKGVNWKFFTILSSLVVLILVFGYASTHLGELSTKIRDPKICEQLNNLESTPILSA